MFRRPLDPRLSGVCALALGVATTGCGQGEVCFDSWFATEVVAAAFGPGQDFGRDRMPDVVLGPPDGGGCCKGSLDVLSLGHGGSITVRFDRAIVDGEGADFVVFENPFQFGSDVYVEPATVEVSADGVEFVAFSCTGTVAPFGNCAGLRPVFHDGREGPVDPETAGGDPFDLAEVGLVEARFVRVTDRPDVVSPDGGSFDLDAVGIVHGTDGLAGAGCDSAR